MILSEMDAAADLVEKLLNLNSLINIQTLATPLSSRQHGAGEFPHGRKCK